MKTYLVEAYSDEIEFDKNSIIVALTPEVCYQLDKKNIKYTIIEDYYDAVEVSNHVEEYRLFISRWIEHLDKFLLNNVKGLNLKLGTIYHFHLKGIVLDPIYNRAYALRHLVEKIKPTNIIYITSEPNDQPFSLRLEQYGRSLYSQVIPLLCDQKTIPLSTVFLKAEEETRKIQPNNQRGGIISRLKTTLYNNSQLLRRTYFTYKYLKKLPYLNQRGQQKHNIFLIRISHLGENLVAEALVRGHQVYLLKDDEILKYTVWGTKKHLSLKSGAYPSGEYNWGNAAAILAGHDLIKQINEKFQLDVTEILLPRLKHFILNVCPRLVSYIQEFRKFFDDYKLDLLITPSLSYLQDFAALTAANDSPRMKTICLEHGDGVYDSRVWNINELQNFDVHISSNTETRDYFIKLAKEIHSTTKLYCSVHRLLNVKKIAVLRERAGRNNIRKNRVIYLPSFMMWDTRRNEGDPYSDTWIYRLQKAIIEYFAKRKDYTFVWKLMPTSEQIYNPLPDFIRDNQFSNIEIATNPFFEHLLTAGRVIQDCPSTGFYESVLAGVPTLCLYPDSLIVRKEAVAYFGNLLKLFSDTSEAIKHIDNFLNSDADLYKMTIETEDNNIFDIIEESGEEENK